MKRLLRNRDGILVGGHRGCKGGFTENTIPALEEGFLMGADYVEIDIQRTKDGEIIVYHDIEFSKETGLAGCVYENTLEEIREKIEVNTFDEVLEWASEKEAYLALELKTEPFFTGKFNDSTAKKIASLIDRHGLRERVLIFGKDYRLLRCIRNIDSKITIGIIVPFVPEDPVRLMEDTGASVYISYIKEMTPEIIKALKEAGYYVSGSIIEDKYWLEIAEKLNIDMYDTDYPFKHYREINKHLRKV